MNGAIVASVGARGERAQTRRPRAWCLLRRVGVVDPASIDDYTAHGGYDARAAGVRARRGGCRSARCSTRARRARRRGVPHRAQVAGGRRHSRQPHLPRVQRRRDRAGHVQGPGAHGGRSVRRDRGDDHRRATPPAASGATSTCGASTRWRCERLRARHRRGPRRRAARATTSTGAGFASTSRCAAARAPTSAARRRRSSTPSRGTAASPATSRRSRSRSACSASRRGQQRRDARQRAARSSSTARPPTRRSAPRARPEPSCSACRAAWRVRACTRSPFGVYAARAARRWRVACAVGGTLQACCSAARPARSCGPTRLDLALTFEGTRAAARVARVGRRAWCSTTPSTSCRSCGASPRSSATSPAGSACPAASARCARRRCSHRLAAGQPRGSVDAELTLLADIGQAMRDASICGLGQTA